LRVRGVQLFGIVGRARSRKRLEWLDEKLLGRWPGLGRFCRYVMLTVEK
jgi:hypothetical protein